MDNPIYKSTVDLNVEVPGEFTSFDLGTTFPNSLITNMGFDLEITVINDGVPVDLSSPIAVTLKIKANETVQAPTTLAATGVISGAGFNVVTFVVDKDILPASVALFPQSDSQPTILLYADIEDANSKIQVRKLISVFDQDGAGSGSGSPPANEMAYSPAVGNDWTSFIVAEPDDVAGALDDLAAEVANKEAILVDGANIAWDLFQQRNSTVTLTANRILDNPTNIFAGGQYTLRVLQDGVGGHTLTYDTAYLFPGGVAPVVAAGVNAVSLITFYCDGTSMLQEAAILDLQ